MQKIKLGLFFLLFSSSIFGQPKINSVLKQKLDSIFNEDQKWRELFATGLVQTKSDSLAESFKIEKKELFSYVLKMTSLSDSLNIIEIEKVIKEYGYPGKTLVGTETNNAAFFVIQHSKKIDKYLPIIKKAAIKKEISFQLYAMMLDRSLMYKGKEQIYGTQGQIIEGISPLTGKKERVSIIWPITNAENINKKRKEVGFESTVEEYAKEMGIDYKIYTLEDIQKMKRL